MQVDKLEPIPNVLHLNDVDHGERAKLVKVGLELIAKKKRKDQVSMRGITHVMNSGSYPDGWRPRVPIRV